MTISIEKLNERKKQLAEDFNAVSKRIEDSERELVTLRNNRNALAGAIQQVNLFLQDLQPAETEAKGKTNSGSSKADKEKGMPAAKQEALNIATS
jgi:chromosome segregation ATPase